MYQLQHQRVYYCLCKAFHLRVLLIAIEWLIVILKFGFKMGLCAHAKEWITP